jgi:hypothetical protein
LSVIGLASRYNNPIINTLPRRLLCVVPSLHTFTGTQIWAHGETHFQPPVLKMPDMEIHYNGEPSPTWYRASRVFGDTTVEWPGNLRKPPVQGVKRVTKPLATNCTCWQGHVHHVGRFGQWQKGVLLHHVQQQVTDILNPPQGKLF